MQSAPALMPIVLQDGAHAPQQARVPTPPPHGTLLSLEDCPSQLHLPGAVPQHVLQAPGIGSFSWDDIFAVSTCIC